MSLYSFSFIYSLIFVVFFILLTLNLISFSFSSSSRCKFRLFETLFLTQLFITVNFPFRTAYAGSHISFGMLYFHHHLSQDFLLFFLISYLTYWFYSSKNLIFKYFWIFQIFFFLKLIWFCIVDQKDAWCDFSVLKFTMACFVA